MSGVIFALVEHPDSALSVLAGARNLAALMGTCRINVLAVRVPPEATILPSEEVLTARQAAEIRTREQKRIGALHAIFTNWSAAARTADVATEWTDVEGLVETLVGEWGRRSDYLVLKRPGPHDRPLNRLEMHAALFNTNRAVLVVPPGPSAAIGAHVAIAWRADKRTEHAVLTAVRLLPPGTQVHVLAGVKPGAASPVLPDVLAEHGIEAVLHKLAIGAGPFGETLLAQAHGVGADLLVMGAYTHTPWRERLLGGVTRYVLEHADLPVLMRH
jgi:nucleotide-binding universal stress UspA family protein